MTVVLLVISVEAGDYYYRGYEFIELKSVEGAACKLPGIPSSDNGPLRLSQSNND